MTCRQICFIIRIAYCYEALLIKNDTLTDHLVEKIEKPKQNLKLPLKTDTKKKVMTCQEQEKYLRLKLSPNEIIIYRELICRG